MVLRVVLWCGPGGGVVGGVVGGVAGGAVGWWGVMSALLSIHLVRGSASFLLRLARGRVGGGEGGGRRKRMIRLGVFFSFVAMMVNLLCGELKPTQSCALMAAENIYCLKLQLYEV